MRRVATALVLSLAAACAEPERPTARNVVLVVVDTLRADRLGCYGYDRPSTPFVDRLAQNGTVYEECRSQGCWTVPSMISMMSGRYVASERDTLPRDVPVLAESVRGAGIATAAFVGNPVLAGERGFRRGFDHFEAPCGDALGLVESFGRWLEAHEDTSGERFFAWIHPIDPHHPYEPDERFRSARGARPGEAELERRWRAADARLREDDEVLGLELADAIEAIREQNDRYDGEVAAVDAAIGELLTQLAARGILDETLIVLASDHGEKLWEHPHYPQELEAKRERLGGLPEGVKDAFAWGHRAWFHEELWRTPLVLAGPGMPRGARRSGLAANLDIAPTVLAAFGLSVPESFLGESLLGGATPTRTEIFGYGFLTSAAVDSSGRKVVLHDSRRFAPLLPATEHLELFDLRRDPHELTPELDPNEPPGLARSLRAWRERWSVPAADRPLGERDLAALRALGYAE